MGISLGSTSGIGRMVTAIIGLLVMAVIALQFAPNVLLGVDTMFLEGKKALVLNGERMTRVVEKQSSPNDNADASWNNAASSAITTLTLTSATVGACQTDFTAYGLAENKSYYTPEGEEFATAAKTVPLAACAISDPSRSTVGVGGIWLLLVQVIGVVLIVGPIGFLAWMGTSWVRSAGMGGVGSIALIIGAVVGVVIIAETLATLFAPLDELVEMVSGQRLAMFQEGIGTITRELANFYVIGLAAALIGLGMLYWRTKGSGGMGGV